MADTRRNTNGHERNIGSERNSIFTNEVENKEWLVALRSTYSSSFVSIRNRSCKFVVSYFRTWDKTLTTGGSYMKRVFFGLAIVVVSLFAQTAIEGAWEGTIVVLEQELATTVSFSKSGDSLTATIDIPQQNASNLKLEKVSFDGTRVHFELAAQTRVIFDGKLDTGKITGDFTQAGFKGTFELAPAKRVATGPPPYREEEVSIKVNAEVTLAGTLSLPPDSAKHRAVILITGSGQQDRDENVFGFKVFKVLADSLTRAGIVVLRCDDRGFGKSKGGEGGWNKNTSRDFAQDVLAQVDYLKTRPEVDTVQLGLLGHSEGALIAGMVAVASPSVAFVVLMAGSAVRGDQLLLAQLEAVMRADSVSEKKIARQRDIQRRIFEFARTGKGEEALRKDIGTLMLADISELPAEQRKVISNTEEIVKKQVDGQIAAVTSPGFRFFLDYDPRSDLGRMQTPMLALFGKFDVQVPAEMNARAMEETFKKAGKINYTIKTCCQANHLFQSAKTGGISEYGKLPKEFTPCFLPTIINWILGKPIPEKCEGEQGNPHEGCPKAETGNCAGCPYHQK